MNRTLTAACAALLLVGSLTACGTNTNTAAPQNGTTGTNDPNGTPSGTSYVAPRRTQYPNGADQDRESYNRMTSSRRSMGANSEPRSNSLYTAYSDGYVYPGTDAMTPDSGPGMVHDAARAARDMVGSTGAMIRDAGNAIRNAVGGINDTRKSTAGEPDVSQRMGNNANNTMLNANAE